MKREQILRKIDDVIWYLESEYGAADCGEHPDDAMLSCLGCTMAMERHRLFALRNELERAP